MEFPLDSLLSVWGLAPEEVRGFSLALARAAPSLVLIPAFGYGAASVASRVALAFSLAVCIAPALSPVDPAGGLSLASAALEGLPIALVAATSLFAAHMAGELMGLSIGLGRDVERSFGTAMGLFVAVMFLEFGGATEVARQLAQAPPDTSLARAIDVLARGIGVAAVIAMPLLVSRVFIDLVSALLERTEPGGSLRPVVRALSPLAVLFAAALLFERMAELAATVGR